MQLVRPATPNTLALIRAVRVAVRPFVVAEEQADEFVEKPHALTVPRPAQKGNRLTTTADEIKSYNL